MRIGTVLAATALTATALLGATGTAFAHDHDNDHDGCGGGATSQGMAGNLSIVGGLDGVVDKNWDNYNKEAGFDLGGSHFCH
ncbi:hypothetical protein N4G70_32785 [Streptomyces sp. ASQP_92]|uniref:hypothetical protein n=1 Tax=Streptomyces sp. ASQP_92 TaxID=2979116 RepID=UPI0021C0B37C|nr:hypothetical protein [Streptomyces sp. ASQP_92]MCT9093611.1 hypothetical protein [Streptomyces sp. ASQP_92]